MTKQFENNLRSENSKEALETLLKTLSETEDIRLALWVSEYAVDACKQKILDRQREIIRCERFKYSEDIARLKVSLAQAEACYVIALSLYEYMRWVSTEGGPVVPVSK